MALYRSTKGLDLPIAGAPAGSAPGAAGTAGAALERARCSRIGLLGADTPGLRPSFLVEPGSRVRRGQALYFDRRAPLVRFTAPAAGVVTAIVRGERRAFVALEIALGNEDADDSSNQVAFESRAALDPQQPTREAVRALLLESGLWPGLRRRPFSHVAPPDETPAALFVTAMDTRPHAPWPSAALAGRDQDFGLALRALAQLTDGPLIVCASPATVLQLPAVPRLRVEHFVGPHPAGNVGWHIHTLQPADLARPVWHISYADALAIGQLIRTGRLEVERGITLAGPGVLRPRALRVRQGAAIDELVRHELAPGAQRVISGSVLDGRMAAAPDAYLGRYHLQVSVLPEGGARQLFGWIAPGADRFSVSRVVLGALRGGSVFNFDTATHGGPRAMVPIGNYERVLPFDIAPTFLLRALVTGDDEQAAALGALELDEEDLALATYVCPGKTEYGPLLRAALERIEKAG
jgi:Na+-transporting NADH:ubiquinone oxidoreductase subunit A